MKTMTPKEFIQQVLITETGQIHTNHPYISFAIMAIGIEFLGKCLNDCEDWNEPRRSKIDFELAVNTLPSLTTYRPLLSSHNLWDSLRNGFAHSFVPKNTLSLSSNDETSHLTQITATKINLKCEDFYNDFKNACNEVLAMTTFPSNKMSNPFLSVPSDNDNIGNIKYSGSTY